MSPVDLTMRLGCCNFHVSWSKWQLQTGSIVWWGNSRTSDGEKSPKHNICWVYIHSSSGRNTQVPPLGQGVSTGGCIVVDQFRSL